MQCFRREEIEGVVVLYSTKSRIIEDRWIRDAGEELFHLVDEERCKRILISFVGVDFISSAFLGKLMALDKKIKGAGGRGLVLCQIVPAMYEVLAITQLNQLFRIKETLEQALALFESAT